MVSDTKYLFMKECLWSFFLFCERQHKKKYLYIIRFQKMDNLCLDFYHSKNEYFLKNSSKYPESDEKQPNLFSDLE